MFTFEHSSFQCQAEEIGHPKLTPDDKYLVLSECIHSQVNMANASLDTWFTTNRLGNHNLIHNGYRFQVKLSGGDRCNWQSSTHTCTATINTHNNLPTNVSAHHNHPSDSMELKVNDILHVQCMRDRYKDELTPIPTTCIYEEELVKLRNHEWNDESYQLVANIPTFQSCKGQLYN